MNVAQKRPKITYRAQFDYEEPGPKKERERAAPQAETETAAKTVRGTAHCICHASSISQLDPSRTISPRPRAFLHLVIAPQNVV